MRPAIISLIGYPAAGKLTVARELEKIAAANGHRLVVVDNHHVNNVIFSVIRIGGHGVVPPGVWDHVRKVRNGVMGAIEELSPRGWSFVFTNVLIDAPADRRFVKRLRDLASQRRSRFVIVRLECSVPELQRRIVRRDRQARMKWLDPNGVRRLAETVPLLSVDSALRLDTTRTTAKANAALIWRALNARPAGTRRT